MFLLRSLGVIICTLFVFTTSAFAAEVNFDDLTEVFDEELVSPYAGFTWENFRYFTFDFNNDSILDGFDRGVVSPENAAYSGGEVGDPGSETTRVGHIGSPTPFDFVSAYFGAINYTSMVLTVQGFHGAVMTVSTTINLDNNGADQFFFPTFTNLTSLRMFGVEAGAVDNGGCGTYNCTQFTIDNFQFTPVPEPSTLTLVGAGALAGFRRLRRRR